MHHEHVHRSRPLDDDIPYLLLTPGPLTTSRTVREAMRFDYSTWDADYNRLVDDVRNRIVRLATHEDGYTSVLMPGSGTFSVESVIGSVVPPDGKILILNNGAYGARMVEIAARLKIDHVDLSHAETEPPDLSRLASTLENDPAVTHVAMVHCETTTGMLNPAREVGRLAARFGKNYIVDAMSSFAGIPMSMEAIHADYLVSSSNKCVQGVPGFGFVIARRAALEQTRGWARSLSLDLHDQWQVMERDGGKWRFTSPTHVVCAFSQALDELEAEGGVSARHERYCENHRRLTRGMAELGFQALLPSHVQSPIITSFLFPKDPAFEFSVFYEKLKARRFVIYPGKVTNLDTFRIGNIGHVFPEDMDELIHHTGQVIEQMGVQVNRT